MNLSAEKRKMPRMRVDLSARIFWGIPNNRSDVNIQNLSIHGISFRSKKYFTQGEKFHLLIPNQEKESSQKKIQVEVVRCETLNGFSSGGKFRVGAKFLFKTHRPADLKENPATGTPVALQPIDCHEPFFDIFNSGIKSYPAQTHTQETRGPCAMGVGIRAARAELIQSVRTPEREETVYTSIQIRQMRFISSSSSSMRTPSEEFLPGIGNRSSFSANLARQNFPDKR